MTDTDETTIEAPDSNSDNRIAGWGEDPVRLGVPQRVFGELLKLSARTVERYHGDFYHDAQWIERYITAETFSDGRKVFAFSFGYDEDGTAIGTDQGLAAVARKNVVQVIVWKQEREFASSTAWHLQITPVITTK